MPSSDPSRPRAAARGSAQRLIESDRFDFEFLSQVAERESWRKEVHRPIYHVHKWWAKRLGTIFRGIVLGCRLTEDKNVRAHFYGTPTLGGVVFDPFMGSGTTVGEAHKLGCIALGRDINPVACESVRVALGDIDRDDLMRAFAHLSSTVGERIRRLYHVCDARGQDAEALYYFWVKQAACPSCTSTVDLFPSRIFVRNAYPDRKPEVRACCPHCGGIVTADHRQTRADCPHCAGAFDLHHGPAHGAKATCPSCAQVFSIADALKRTATPPAHRLYAKLVLTADGEKRYEPAIDADIAAAADCSSLLADEIAAGRIRLPDTALAPGYNTKQAINYNYRRWRDFFNDRQLLALGWLQHAIAAWPVPATRDALLTLFSGVLEFNNLFASYKGEGTGAVRHMFANHVLKPERLPIEANVWGTPKSSGSFAGLFRSRLLRALDYRTAPAEVVLEGKKRLAGTRPLSCRVEANWPADGRFSPGGIYLSCGSSAATGLPAGSVDFVVTDPPFFDNVHYSELADFFHAWQVLYPRGFIRAQSTTTRNPQEVQDTEADAFAAKLRAVFTECHRVLRDDGLLVFSYHHSRTEGWMSLADAVFGAGFSVVNAHPVKAEMSVAAPKSLAEEPIQIDVLLVCRKAAADPRAPATAADAIAAAAAKSARLRQAGFTLSLNDRRVILASEGLRAFGPPDNFAGRRDELSRLLDEVLAVPGTVAEFAPAGQAAPEVANTRAADPAQLPLWAS